MGNHTPGPWILTADKVAVGDSSGRELFVDPRSTLLLYPLVEREANLLLAAAAPELLEVAREAVKELTRLIGGATSCGDPGEECPLQDSHKDWSTAGVLRRLQAVIVKATGEDGSDSISPSAAPCTGPVAESSDGAANSSEGKVEQKPTPGDKSIGGSTAHTWRRLKDSGDSFEEKLKDP